MRKKAEEYIKQWQWPYDSQSVPLPLNRSAPQPIIPVIDGFQCQNCEYTTRNRKAAREHGNKAHSLKRVPDEEIFTAVQL
jgi:hypothetical protein